MAKFVTKRTPVDYTDKNLIFNLRFLTKNILFLKTRGTNAISFKLV